MRDGIAVLLDELSAMPAASRRAILRALSPAERDALLGVPGRTRVETAALPGLASPFSPWLRDRIEALQDHGTLDLAASRMTAAAKQSLLRSAGTFQHAAAKTAAPVVGKSLFDTFGGKLAARMGRP